MEFIYQTCPSELKEQKTKSEVIRSPTSDAERPYLSYGSFFFWPFFPALGLGFGTTFSQGSTLARAA